MDMMRMYGTKWEIFKNAVDLFSKSGVEAVSVKDIAEASGIRASSVYNHFESKEAIVKTMYDYYNYYALKHREQTKLNLDPANEAASQDFIKKLNLRYQSDMQEIMMKILHVAAMRMRSDPEADKLIGENTIEMPKHFIRLILEDLTEREEIEPLDIEAACELFACACYSAVMRLNTNHEVGDGNWDKMLRLLQSLIARKSKGE